MTGEAVQQIPLLGELTKARRERNPVTGVFKANFVMHVQLITAE